jgi:hypothetical protein
MDLSAGLGAARSFLIFPGNDECKLVAALSSGRDAPEAASWFPAIDAAWGVG